MLLDVGYWLLARDWTSERVEGVGKPKSRRTILPVRLELGCDAGAIEHG
jgi:hypothetical protein